MRHSKHWHESVVMRGNRSIQRKTSKSGWDPSKLSTHAAFAVRVEGMVNAQPDSPRSTARKLPQVVTHPVINPIQQGLTSVNGRDQCFSLVRAVEYFKEGGMGWIDTFVSRALDLDFAPEDFKSRFNTKYMKESLAYRYSILWNTVNFNEHEVSQL